MNHKHTLALIGVLASISATAPGSPWPRHTITVGAQTGSFRGADGVAEHDGCFTTAWEEGGLLTDACPPADVTQPWTTSVIATGLVGVEDVKSADLDGDGRLDAVSASDSGQRIYVSFGGGATSALPWSIGHGHAMQVAIADVNNDGLPDIVFGTRVGAPAVVAWLENPGFLARIPSAWTYHLISLAGWTMSVVPLDVDGDGDLDVVVSDRASYRDADGVTRWGLYGARWEEQVPGGWIHHAISPPAGTCAGCTPGDEMFLWVGDWDGDGTLDVIDGTSSAGHPNRIVIRRNLGASQELVPPATGTGHYQGVDVGDLDGDGRLDLVVSTWEVNGPPCSGVTLACSTATGVYWLRNAGAGAWEVHDVSGPEGSKFDNVQLWDVDGDGRLDVVTSEQVDQLGVIWYQNPGR